MSFLDSIKAIPITDYAQRCGYTLVRKGTRYVSLVEHDSVMIDVQKNCFWRNSVFQKGRPGGAGSIIDFAMEFMGYERNKAMRELALMYGIQGDKKTGIEDYMTAPKPLEPQKRKIGELELPPRSDSVSIVFRYLLKERKIDRSVIRYFLAKGMLYQDAEHGNCVFVSHKFACIRSTNNIRFMRDLSGCDYNECFFFRPSRAARTLVVAESVIDIMSIMTFFVRENKRYTEYAYLALAGTNKLPSLFYHLEQEDDINQVLIAFDNDDAGKAAEKAALIGLENIGFNGNAEIFAPPCGKDWNDYIKFCESEHHEN